MKIFTKLAVTALITISALFQTHATEIYTITKNNADKTVDIKLKDGAFQVELPRALVNMDDITAWQFDSANTNAPVNLIETTILPNEGLDGSAGKDVFVFKITETGCGKLVFKHVLIKPSGELIDEVLIPSSISFNIKITE